MNFKFNIYPLWRKKILEFYLLQKGYLPDFFWLVIYIAKSPIVLNALELTGVNEINPKPLSCNLCLINPAWDLSISLKENVALKGNKVTMVQTAGNFIYHNNHLWTIL